MADWVQLIRVYTLGLYCSFQGQISQAVNLLTGVKHSASQTNNFSDIDEINTTRSDTNNLNNHKDPFNSSLNSSHM